MRITLKDVAEKCNVSITLVSAVLNNRHGRVRYTDETRAQILAAARELGYQPNIVARTMACRRSPVVGVMLTADSIRVADGNFAYFNQIFPTLTELLNEKGLEVLFVPFRNEQEQLEKLSRLTGAGLVGSIITNIISDSYHKIVPELQKLSMPYMILGNPREFDCHCVYTAFDFSWSNNFMKYRKLKKSVMVTSIDGKINYYQLPFPDDYFWENNPIEQDLYQGNSDEILFICTDLSVLHSLPQLPKNVILISNDHLIPPGIPAVICHPGYQERLQYTADTISSWLFAGRKPVPHKVCLKPQKISEFINFVPEELPDYGLTQQCFAQMQFNKTIS